jgi:hypothetical protein
MAEHTGVFNWLKAKVTFIQSRDFIAYFTSDGSIIPQSQLPNDNALVTRGMLNTAVGSVPTVPIFRIPFTAQTGATINWQTDKPDGTNTYQSLYGNNVEAFVYFPGTPGGQPYTWTIDGSGNVLAVTFDWGTSQSGYIRW